MILHFVATAPAKVNLHLGVGEARADGYHDLVTVFQSVDLWETVRLSVDTRAPRVTQGSVVTGMTTSFGVKRPGEDIDTPANLAWRAVDAVVDAYRRTDGAVSLPRVSIEVEKNVFVAGGMAGGSADAAAALLAANAFVGHYGGTTLSRDTIVDLAKSLGADVPFCLMGGTALGTGRGDEVVEMMSRGLYWWVFINPSVPLPTGEAFSRLDDLRHNDASVVPHLNTTTLSRCLLTGEPRLVARALHNDLQPVAVAMRPQLRALLDFAADCGLRAIVSGSGPTVALLCEDEENALDARDRIEAAFDGYEIVCAAGPTTGAREVLEY